MQLLLTLTIFSRNKNMKELLLFVPDFCFPLNGVATRSSIQPKMGPLKLFGEVFYKDPPKKMFKMVGQKSNKHSPNGGGMMVIYHGRT